jgi:hypothetical protein
MAPRPAADAITELASTSAEREPADHGPIGLSPPGAEVAVRGARKGVGSHNFGRP